MMTCFADDTHLAWKVEGLEDLAFVCKTVRAVFALLDDCGMVANADKSSVIMGIRGTSARKWIQSHQVVRNGQKFVNFGLPSAPLLVPSVKQFGYLGVQVSYGAFEMQTLLFRQQAASGLPSAPLLVPSVKQFGYLGVQVSYGAFEMQTLLFRQQAASANRARLVANPAPQAAGFAETSQPANMDASYPRHPASVVAMEESQASVALQEMHQEPEKWSKPESKRSWGKGQRWNDKWQSESTKNTAKLDEPTLHLLRTLTKMTLRLEEEVGRYRADTGFMLFVDTLTEQNTLQLLRAAAQGWQKSFEEGTVKSSLRIVLFTGLMNKLLETLRLVQTDDALRARLMTVGWLSEGSNALVPTWHYYRWDPETRQQVKDDRAPLAQDQVMHQVEILMRVGTSPTTLLRFKTLHKL
eukprot:s9117_g1.t1